MVEQKKPWNENIVICSDGTWAKGGSATPTNVWRTYLAIAPEHQAKFHDDGVGTGRFRLSRIIGGGFGYGITRNIKEMLVELSVAYSPDSKIFLFGFSRGAYTVRVIANLVCMFGVPDVRGKSTEAVRQLVSDMVGAYKRANEIRSKAKDDSVAQPKLESVPVVQKIRSECHYYSADNREQPEPKPLIHFVGCWDTVEALGIPFETLKTAVTHWFPLKFQDAYPNAKIKHLYQALALDEERHTFSPKVWEIPKEGLSEGQTLQQVWFPGCHSHVGGSYPKDQLALEALEWMLEKAEQAGLRLNQEIRQRYRDEASRYGQLIDSRSGLGAFYRYCPRQMSLLQKPGTHNGYVLHASAIDRIVHQTDGYAPRSIDVDEITIVENECHSHGAANPDKISFPDEYKRLIKTTSRQMQLGRVFYWLGIGICVATLAIGWATASHDPTDSYHARAGLSAIVSFPLKVVGTAEHLALALFSPMVPQFLDQSVIQGFRNTPGILTLFVLALASLIYLTARLKLLMTNNATSAWHTVQFHGDGAEGPMSNMLIQSGTVAKDLDVAAPQRFNIGWFRMLRRLVLRIAAGIAGVIIFVLMPLGIAFQLLCDTTDRLFNKDSAWLRFGLYLLTIVSGLLICFFVFPPMIRGTWNAFHSYEEQQSEFYPVKNLKDAETVEVDFLTDNGFSPTGIYVEKGRNYRIEIVSTSEDWLDKTIKAGPKGIADPEQEFLVHRLRQSPNRPLFELTARIHGRPASIPIGADKSFIAPTSGHLFLFVNDVRGYFGNNHGKSEVRITCIPDSQQP